MLVDTYFSENLKMAFSIQEKTEQLRRNGEEYLCDPNNTKSAVRLLVQIAQGKFSTRLAQAAGIQDILGGKARFPTLADQGVGLIAKKRQCKINGFEIKWNKRRLREENA